MKAVGPPSPHKIPVRWKLDLLTAIDNYLLFLLFILIFKLLEAKCRSTEQCLAFNSFGEIKTQLLPVSAWVNVSQDSGLFVADVDVCTADLHDCASNADCHKTGSVTELLLISAIIPVVDSVCRLLTAYLCVQKGLRSDRKKMP